VASQRSKMMVGIFVAAGLLIALAAVIWLGMSRFLQEGAYYVTYFDESVQGLSKDSPVKYRGVSIGRVGRIDVAPDSELIEVVLKIESGQKLGNGMVCRLKPVGITGSVFVEIDRRRPDEPRIARELSFPTEFPVIPSRPSEISELLRGLDDVIDKVRALDVEDINQRIKTTLDGANRIMAEADIKGVSDSIKNAAASWENMADTGNLEALISSVEQVARSLESTLGSAVAGMESLNRVVARIEGLVDKSEEPLHQSLTEMARAVGATGRLVKELSDLTGETHGSVSTLTRQLSSAAQNLEKATDDLKRFTEQLAEQPSLMIFGDPPPPRFPEPGH
jgi:phospholipid/cholesterol/gamma-HCH transport system substrate-binding protein